MRVAVDTNVLLYAEGLDDARRQILATDTIDRIGRDRIVAPVQVLGEVFRVVVRKARKTPGEAAEIVEGWRATLAIAATTTSAFDAACGLAVRHGLQIWDAIIIAVAAEAQCTLLLSEDLQEGFTWAGVTVVNPLRDPPHPLLLRAFRTD